MSPIKLNQEQLAAFQLVVSAEAHLLKTFGWTRMEPPKEQPSLVLWKPPAGYDAHKGIEPGKEWGYNHAHAVNSVKARTKYKDWPLDSLLQGKKDDDAR